LLNVGGGPCHVIGGYFLAAFTIISSAIAAPPQHVKDVGREQDPLSNVVGQTA
jgi:hypothetical protein